MLVSRKSKKDPYASADTHIAANRYHLLTEDTPFAIKEAYIKLRTNLMFCMTGDGEKQCKVFAVTSANPSEGKSLTAANIAICCAMLGKKTVLIDADMRKPTQHRLWSIKNTVGLCDFIARIRPLRIAMVENLPLSIICTGTIPPNPSEMISSDRMRELVKECSNHYDYVIIDTPPINTVADAQIISTFVDGILLVARSGEITTDELSAAVEAVRNSGGNLCGVVLNDISMKSQRNSYRYKYGSKYGYRYSYKYGDKYRYETKTGDTAGK